MSDKVQVAPVRAFTTDLGVPMVAKILQKDYTPKPLVEFYDLRYPFAPIMIGKDGELKGQFISRYYAETLLMDAKRLERFGLCLDGGIPGWNVDDESMNAVLGWIQVYLEHRNWLYGEDMPETS